VPDRSVIGHGPGTGFEEIGLLAQASHLLEADFWELLGEFSFLRECSPLKAVPCYELEFLIRTLRWKDVDLENRVLRVAESKTRAGEGRPIPLTQPAWAALQYWAERFPRRRSEHFVFPACENGQVDPTRGIASWRTAWRRVTGAIQCPSCREIQSPRKICRNVECRAEIRATLRTHSRGFVSTISATQRPSNFWSRVHRLQSLHRSLGGQPVLR
jgi:hypothetical protein